MAPPIVSREKWLQARKELLLKEKVLTRARDDLTAARQSLPMVKIEKTYQFTTDAGDKSLADLFGPHDQLIVYHFMFGPDWEEGCPSCSFWADNYNGIAKHLAARNTGLVAVSNAAIEKPNKYKKRLGRTFPWVSAAKTTFSQDFGVSFGSDNTPSDPLGYNYSGHIPNAHELPGLSVFLKQEDRAVYHTYSSYARGLDMFNSAYQLLDMTPLGRNEEDLEFPMAWVKRRDEYL